MTIEDKILAWCRANAPKGRVLGMRSLVTGAQGEPCVVLYVDTMRGAYLGRYGVPDEPRQYDPAVVVASGATWDAVASKLGIASAE